MATAPPPAGQAPPYRPSTPPSSREAHFTSQGVQPPSPLYLQAEDFINLNIQAPVLTVGTTLILVLRFQRPDGEITLTRRPVVGGGVSASLNVSMGEGWLLSATLSNTGVGPAEPGTVYAILSVQRDSPETGLTGWVLFADYITLSHLPTWPFGRNNFGQEGPGRVRSVTGSTPAAGQDINEAVPSNIRWRLLMGAAVFTASAAVANRNIAIIVDDGGNILYRWNTNTSITAGQSVRVVFSSVNQPGVSDATGQILFIQDNLLMGPAFRFRTSTANIQAGDQWAGLQYLVQEWVSL